MPRIPDVTALGARPTPDSGRGVYRPPQSRAGQGMMAAGASFQQTGAELQQNVDKFNYSKAKADYLTQSLELDSQFQNDTDYKTLPDRYSAAVKGKADAILAAVPDPNLRSQLAVDLQVDMARSNAAIRQRANSLWKDDELGQAVTQADQFKKSYIATKDPKYITAVKDRWEGLKAAGVIDANVAAQKMISDADEMITGRLKTEPASFRVGLSSRFKAPMTPEKYANPTAAIDFVVDKLEDDGKGTVTFDSGGVTKYGVSQKWNPDIDVMNLSKEQAKKIMKERYWDKANIDMFPDNMKLLVFDAAVNQGPETALTMAAMAGNDPERFIALRRARYEQLAADDPAKYGGNLRGWNNRLDRLSDKESRYVPAGDIYDNLSPDKLLAISDAAVTEQRQETIQGIKTGMRFADYNIKQAAKQQYQNDSGVISAIEAIEKDLREDPAGYSAQSPAMTEAYNALQQNDTPEQRDKYFDALKDEQMRQGVPEHMVRYAPKAVIDDFKSTVSSENATSSQVIKKINDIKEQFGSKYGHVLGELRQDPNGISGPYAVAADLAGSGNVEDLVEAAMLGKEKLTQAIPATEDTKGLRAAVDGKMEDFTAAINFLPNGPKMTNDYKDAVELLALNNMRVGMKQSAALDKAMEAVVPYDVDGTIVVPKGVNITAVRQAAEDYKSKIANLPILLPPEFGDKVTPQSEIYMNGVKNIKPVVQGDKILFYWENKNPVLDKSKVRYFPGTNRVANAGEAALSISLDDAISNTASVSAPQVQESIVSDRALLTAGLNRDINDFYKVGAALEGVKPASALIPLKGDDGYDRLHIISQPVYDALPPDQKAQAKKQIEESVRYNQMVLSRIPDAQKETFRKYVARSNAVAENYHYYDAQIPKTWSGGMSGRQKRELGEKSNQMQYLRSIGYQFLEVPEWAK